MPAQSQNWAEELRRLREELHAPATTDDMREALTVYLRINGSRTESCLESARRDLGDRLDSLLQSREATAARIAGPDAKERKAALSLINNYWGVSADEAPLYAHHARNDPSEPVRRRALWCYHSCYSGTRDAAAARFLASIVRDESETTDVRLQAYHSLQAVLQAGSPSQRWSDTTFEQIDWGFVDSVIEGTTKPS